MMLDSNSSLPIALPLVTMYRKTRELHGDLDFRVVVDRCHTEKKLLLKRVSFNIVRGKQFHLNLQFAAMTNTKRGQI